MHETPWDDVPGDASLVDLNRAGTPLVEIVTEPDSGPPGRPTTSSCGSAASSAGSAPPTEHGGGVLRCDANVSLRPAGAEALGTKVEIKNLNSIAHVKKALEHEVARQAEVLRVPGGSSRRPGSSTRAGRHAPDAVEGRGDGLPLLPRPRPRRARRRRRVARGSRRRPPELPEKREARLVATLGSRLRRCHLCATRPSPTPSRRPSPAPLEPEGRRELVPRRPPRADDRRRPQDGRLPVAPAALARLVSRSTTGRSPGRSPRSSSSSSPGAGRRRADPREGARPGDRRGAGPRRRRRRPLRERGPGRRLRGGKAAAFGWFVGQVMRATGGKASPALVNRLLRERLDA